MGRHTGLCILLAAVCSMAMADIRDVSIDPVEPATLDSISVLVTGLEAVGPVEANESAFSLKENVITLDLDITLGMLQVIRPWSYSREVGQLPAGQYDLIVNANYGPNSVDTFSTSFEVVPEPTSMLTMLAGAALLHAVRSRRAVQVSRLRKEMAMRKALMVLAMAVIVCGARASGGLVEVTVDTDKDLYAPGEIVTVTISAYNPSGKAVVLGFPTGKQATYVLDGLFDYSSVPQYVTVPTFVTIQPFATYIWTFAHAGPAADAYPLDAGEHSIVGVVVNRATSAADSFAVVPEPATLVMMLAGIGLLRLRG